MKATGEESHLIKHIPADSQPVKLIISEVVFFFYYLTGEGNKLMSKTPDRCEGRLEATNNLFVRGEKGGKLNICRTCVLFLFFCLCTSPCCD